MQISVGGTYVFAKSGRVVRAIAPTTRYRGQPMWEVERIGGEDAGLRMDVPVRALVNACADRELSADNRVAAFNRIHSDN